MTTADLIAFEAGVAQAFNAGRIRAPVHLSGGNESWLIDYFARHHDAARGDWVCTTWRSHYHALLAGVPPERVMDAILAGRSITLCFPEHRVVSSAIVGGILPIALGLALTAKRRGAPERVHCFVGDMTARTGAYHEVAHYASNQDLPLSLIVEDNGRSVMTNTAEVWGEKITTQHFGRSAGHPGFKEFSYRYILKYPHAGAGKRIMF